VLKKKGRQANSAEMESALQTHREEKEVGTLGKRKAQSFSPLFSPELE